eukprot:TRINITY_DN251_c0_g1_i3.p1 TRINITY_DN251_c0_g1~~TRINITY_DN251_c0_g1_i3.p1  ORF type:complete len:982 (-),score=265.89 TRINITY_DN251_c0_g1_i3:536-3481(-)
MKNEMRIADLESKLYTANQKLKELSERTEERVNQLTLLLKDAESKASKARDITTRALERLSQVEQTKKTYLKSARIVNAKLKLLDENLNAIDSAFTTLKEKYFNGKEKLKAANEKLGESQLKKKNNDNNDEGGEDQEDDEDEEDEDELWDFVRESLDRLKNVVEHGENEGGNDELSSLHADAVEAGLFVPISASNSPPNVDDSKANAPVKEGFVDALRMVVLNAQERATADKKQATASNSPLPTIPDFETLKKRGSRILGANVIQELVLQKDKSVTELSSLTSTPPKESNEGNNNNNHDNNNHEKSSSMPHSVSMPMLNNPSIAATPQPTNPPNVTPTNVTPAAASTVQQQQSANEGLTAADGTSTKERITLKVVVFEARALKWSEVDPYCSVNVGGTRKSTNVLSQCPDDVWNETFIFENVENEKELVIDCWNKPDNKGEPFLGRVIIHIDEERMGKTNHVDGWFKMTGRRPADDDPSAPPRGDLLLSIEKTVTMEQSPTPSRTVSKKRMERQTSLSGMVKMMVTHSEVTGEQGGGSRKEGSNIEKGGSHTTLSPSSSASNASASGDLNPLQVAASGSRPDLDAIAAMLDKGNYKVAQGWSNEKGQTLLHLMAMKGSAKHLAMLLSSTADLQHKDQFGFTALHLAAVKAPVECIRLLLNAGADVNIEDAYNKLTPLHHAALGGNHHAIKLLISRGATIDHLDRNQATALLKAAYGGHTKCIKALLHAGAGINLADNEGNTAFLVACLEGHFDAALYLKKKGASTTVTNIMGDTPLWCAVRHNNISIVKTLLKETSINQTMGKYKFGILHRCMLQLEEPLCEKIIPMLLKRGLRVDSLNLEGKTPLFYAAFFKKIECMRLLIRNGANVRVRDKAGNTVLHFASSPEAVSLIIEALPKEIITKEVNVQNNQGNSPLHAAYVFYGDSVVQILKQYSADEEAKNVNGNTPSQVAWAAVKKVLLPFFPEDEAMPDCGGLYISKVN